MCLGCITLVISKLYYYTKLSASLIQILQKYSLNLDDLEEWGIPEKVCHALKKKFKRILSDLKKYDFESQNFAVFDLKYT